MALAQSTWGHAFGWDGVHADVVLVAVVCWTLLRGWGEGAVWAVFGALCLDLFSSAPFGISVPPLVTISLLAGLAFGRRFGGYIVLPTLLTFPLTLVFYLVSAPVFHVYGMPMNLGSGFQSIALRAAILNVGATLVFFPLFRWADRLTGGEKIRW